jgi:MoxR-like ATPase
MHVLITYPDEEAEAQIVQLVRDEDKAQASGGAAKIETIPQQVVFDARHEIRAVHVAEAVDRYIVDLVFATRYPERYSDELRKWIVVGSSPRASLALDRCSRVHAWLAGRDHVTPDDVRAVIHDCLRHRIMLSYEANAAGMSSHQLVTEIVKVVAVA